MSQHGNAEASSSRLPRSIVIRRKSQDALKKAAAQSSPSTASRALTENTKNQLPRAVKTVPPGAAYEPPTPPTPSAEHLPEEPLHKREAKGKTTSTAATQKRRRAPRVRYDTSDSSADSTDAETSDDEPPWWTFTQRGMAKMRARTMRKGEEGVGGVSGLSGAESGKDSGREGRSRRGSRQNSKEKKDTPTNSRPSSVHRLQAAAHIRNPRPVVPSSLLWRRSIGRDLPLPPMALHSAPMARSNSAPTSPLHMSEDMPASPGMSTIVGSADEPRLSESLLLEKPDRPVSSRRPILSPKRQITAPAFPRFLKRSDQDIHTDTEAGGSIAPRAKVREKEKLRDVAENGGVAPSAPAQPSEEGSSTPTRPRGQRRATTLLKMSLPDPITQHFAEGWQKGRPHAGTWQDAYYGHYPQHRSTPEEQSVSGLEAPREPNNLAQTSSRRSSIHRPSRRASKKRLQTPDHSERSVPPSPAQAQVVHTAGKRSRRVKGRRYRQALVPPTPSGLGFTPNGSRRDSDGWKEGRVGASSNGYNWNNGRAEPTAANDDLNRSETTGTNEKSSANGSAKKGWFGVFRRQPRPNDRREDIGWRKKARRMLFLDARVTMWIRLVNLAFVVTSLALAVRIRLQLDQLQVPGLLGASTTLLIAFSALTALHVLTAIYREYFGKPIGLWGLRSKMLWVCLDLAFIAFWSSAVSLALNDYISTPLECTSDTPWWRWGLADEYAQLLQNLQPSTNLTVGVTSAEMVSHSLGIVLPLEIINSPLTKQICDKQAGSVVLALITLFLYTGNMVLSLFRIFETVRRTANVDRAVMV